MSTPVHPVAYIRPW